MSRIIRMMSAAAISGLLATTVVGAAATASAAESTAGPTVVAPAHYPCGSAPPDLDPTQRTGRANGVNMRTGSSTSCPSRGMAYMSHQINYHCWTIGSDGYTWTYARNITAGIAGWMRDNVLEDGGSAFRCPQ